MFLGPAMVLSNRNKEDFCTMMWSVLKLTKSLKLSNKHTQFYYNFNNCNKVTTHTAIWSFSCFLLVVLGLLIEEGLGPGLGYRLMRVVKAADC